MKTGTMSMKALLAQVVEQTRRFVCRNWAGR